MGSATLLGMFLAGVVAQQAPPPTTSVPAPAAQEKPIASNLKVRIGTTVYMNDGRVLTTSNSDWPLALNKTVTANVRSGRTLCEPRQATAEAQTDSGPGWQVRFTPVREGANELELRMEWGQVTGQSEFFKRNEVAGRTLTPQISPKQHYITALRGQPASLTLHPGDRIIVDYMPGTSAGTGRWALASRDNTAFETFFAARQNKATTAQGDGCNAVGMSLEIGLEPAKTEAMVEAELWLVRPNADGTEKSERQVLRLPVGQPASSYYFDEARLVAPAQDKQLKSAGEAYAKVFGDVSAFSIGTDGKIHLNFNLSRRYETMRALKLSSQHPADSKVSTSYRDLVATPGEVLAFQLPASEQNAVPQLSVRLRANLVK